MQPNVRMTMTVTFQNGRPFIESRLRSLDDRRGPIPKGKVLVLRTPILPPGASEQEVRAATERKLEPL